MKTFKGIESKVDSTMCGPDWFGLMYLRLYANEDSWITFRGIKLMWFTFLVKVPAVVENWFNE